MTIDDFQYCLATTAIKAFWDKNSERLFLGPWCLTNEEEVFDMNSIFVDASSRKHLIVASPWKSASRIKEASDYCYHVYNKILPQISTKLNEIHNVTYPVEYWRVLIGYWLSHFIQEVYDRYTRIESVLNHYPDFFTYVLPIDKCKPISYCYSDLIFGKYSKSESDRYNLKLISLVAYELCPDRIVVKDYAIDDRVNEFKQGWRRRLSNYFKTPLESALDCKIILANMYNVGIKDLIKLRIKMGLKNIGFREFAIMRPQNELNLMRRMSVEMRNRLVIKDYDNRFEALLKKTIIDAIPICYVEDYLHYSNDVNNNTGLILLGSAVGWGSSELFKFFAAEAVLNGVKLAEFQHGGDYGSILVSLVEKLSADGRIFYSWGHTRKDNIKVLPLPNPRLSKLMDSHSCNTMNNNIVFVGMRVSKYIRRFCSHYNPDDIFNYYNSKKVFLDELLENIKKFVIYRPGRRVQEQEINAIKKYFPEIQYDVKSKNVDLMRKAKIVVVDYSGTSYLEALTINVPTVLYWDHNIYLVRSDAEPYYQALRDAGILHKDPVSAAGKVNEIFDHPMKWWHSNTVQNARKGFCDRFAYARKDWMDVWVNELKKFL